MRFSHGGDFWESYENGKKNIIDFSSNTNALGFPEEIKKEIKPWKTAYYPPAKHEKLKQEIIKFLNFFSEILEEKAKSSLKIKKENIAIASGSVELIKNFSEIFLSSSLNSSEKGSALIPSPAFLEYERYARIYGAKIKFIKPEIRGSKIYFDTGKIISEVHESRPKALFLCTPNNPTASSLSESEIKEIAEACRKNNAMLFIDECFIEFSQRKSSVYFIDFDVFDNVFVIRSFTKFFSIPGLRIGYGIGSRKVVRKIESIALPWNINIFAHDAAIACLRACFNDKSYLLRSREMLGKERKFLRNELEKLGIKVYSSDANFLLLEHAWNAKKLKSWLLERGLLIRECSNFRYLNERFARVSIRRRKENKILVEKIKEYLEAGENAAQS